MNKYKNIRPSSSRCQQGGTILGLLFNCSLFLFIAYIGMKLLPEYNGYTVIQSALEKSLGEFASVNNFNERQLVKSMEKRLYIDGVRVSDLKNKLIVTKGRNSVNVTLPYEKKVHLFSNLGIYLEFEASADK